MTRRDLAVDAFWTQRPLVQRFIAETGRTSFSLRELIVFAEQLSDALFLTFANEVGRRLAGPAPWSTRAAPTRSKRRTRRHGNLTLITQGNQP